jgi:lauroyl/myristoyl acyltransferase
MWFHRRFKSQPKGTPSYYAVPTDVPKV